MPAYMHHASLKLVFWARGFKSGMYGLVLGHLDLYVDWTCVLAPGLILGIGGLLFWMHGLVFGWLDLCMSDAWTRISCVCVFVGCDYGVCARAVGRLREGGGWAAAGGERGVSGRQAAG